MAPWKIRSKAKRTGRPETTGEAVAQPDYAIPRWCARQCVILLRMTHFAFDEMARMVNVLPLDQKALYQYLAEVELRPSFFDALKLIDLSEERGMLSPDEATSIRAGAIRDIENPIPNAGGGV